VEGTNGIYCGAVQRTPPKLPNLTLLPWVLWL